MGFDECLNIFCKKHGYTGHLGYNSSTLEYEIILSKGDNNAGAFLSEEELQSMNNQQFHDLLELLHKGFQAKFNQ
nr:hypothetical protein [uncultured Anaerocolumna sp.]